MTSISSRKEYMNFLSLFSRREEGHSQEYKESLALLDSLAYEIYLLSRNIHGASNAIKDCYQTAKKQDNRRVVQACERHLYFA